MTNLATPPHPTAPARGERCTCGSLFGLVHKPECPEAAEIDKRYGEPTPTGAGEVVDDPNVAAILTAFDAATRPSMQRAVVEGLARGSVGAINDLRDQLRAAREEAGRLGRELGAQEREVEMYLDALEQLGITRGTVNAREAWWWNDRAGNEPCCATAREAAEALWTEYQALAARDAELAGVREDARAWREYAEHVEGCVTCGETSWEDCWEGRTLRDAARSGADKEG